MFQRQTWRKGLYFLGLATAMSSLAAGLFSSSSKGVSKGAQLLPSTDELRPNTTFEVRFEEPAVVPDQVGLPAKESPLVIKPELPGAFTWLSRRSGLFTPSVAPALAQTYRFSLRSGLKGPDGKAIKAQLAHEFTTPYFGLTAYTPNQTNANLPMALTIAVQFNDHVNPATATRYIRFRGPGGLQVPAEVVTLTEPLMSQHGVYFGGNNDTPWAEQFIAPEHRPGRFSRFLEVQRRQNEEIVYPHRLLVKPARPLTPANSWTLVLSKGLPNATGKLRTVVEQVLPLGKMQRLEVTGIEPHNRMNVGREVRLTFNKQLATNLTETTLKDFITVSPSFQPIWMDQSYNSVVIRGRFDLAKEYQVTVRAGLPGQEGQVLMLTRTQAVSFVPLPSRVYLPAFNDDQLAAGQRQFELLTVNLDKVQLKAKAFDETSVIHALRGYRSYFKRFHHDAYDYEEPYREVDYNVIPGKTVYEAEINTFAAADLVGKHRVNWDTVLGERRYGVIFLQAEGNGPGGDKEKPKVGSQALVQVTDLGLVWKRAAGETWVMVFSYATGEPVPGARVRLMTDENELVKEAVSDAQGLARLASNDSAEWLMVTKGNDLHALPLQQDYHLEVPLYRFGVNYSGEDHPPNERRVMLFSERSVYRPGETVYFKAISREWTGEGWTMPQKPEVTLALTDARGRTFLRTNLVFSDFGSLDFSAALPVAPMGEYQAQLSWRDSNAPPAGYFFHVKEVQPNAFEVNLAARPAYRPEEKIEVPLAARYYLGKPLSRATVRWTLNQGYLSLHPEGMNDFQFGSGMWDREEADRGLPILTGEGEVDAEGKLVIAPPVAAVSSNGPQTFSLLAEVTDLNQQTVSAEAAFVRHSSAFYLGIKCGKQVYHTGDPHAGDPVPVAVVAINQDGTPRAEPVDYQARLVKITWRTVAKEGAGKTIVYENERQFEQVEELSSRTLPLEKLGVEWRIPLAAEKTAPIFTVKTPSEYLLVVTARDAEGQPVRSEWWFDVSGGTEEVGWKYRNPVQIELVPDRAVYAPGDQAKVLIKTPISGQALVTVEREKVRRSFVTELKGNAPAIEVPLEVLDAPNVFVSVMMLRGLEKSAKTVKMPEFRIGYCQLTVELPETRLTAEITTSRPSYEPGQQVEVEAVIRDGLSRPAPDTEVTLFAVDEGILSLTGMATPNPSDLFNVTRSLSVRTCFSIPALLPEDPALARFHNKGYLIGGGGGEDDRTRKNFRPCAFWQAKLLTDDQGRVRAAFTAPDSLTRYRVMAVAHSRRQQFGSGSGSFEVNKPLMIAPSLPLFANVGDEIRARAVVHNLTDTEGEVAVALQLDGRAHCAETNATVLVKARGSVAVEFPVTFKEAGTSAWKWRARFKSGTPAFTDAVQSAMEIGYAQPLLREVVARRVRAAETNLLAQADPRLLEGEGSVTVRVSATALAEVGEAAEYLLRYPYGCAEQTVSSLLPWVVLQQHPAGRAILQRSKLDRERAVITGMNRLLAMQTASGGLAYWAGGSQPMPWASAYGGLALALLDREGHEVPPERLQQLGNYLSEFVRGAGDERFAGSRSDHCLALWTLALLKRPEPAYHEKLFALRDRLSAEDRAVLALAILEGNGSKPMAVELLKNRSAGEAGDNWFGCAARERALQLMAWARCQPDAPITFELLETLLGEQTDGHWLTTQGNAWGLWALVDYAVRVEGQPLPVRATLRLNGKVENLALAGELQMYETKLDFKPGNAPSVILGNPNPQMVYARAVISARHANTPMMAQDRGFTVRRAYYRLDDRNQAHELGQPQPGDRVLVTLQVRASRTSHFIAIDDPLPPIFEPVNSEFVTQQTAVTAEDPYYWDHREVRKDRVLYFANHLAAGDYKIQYLARVRAMGRTTAPSTKVEAMYQPQRFGLGGSGVLDNRTGPLVRD